MIPLQVGKSLIFIGVILTGIGLLLVALSRTSFLGPGKLPGDIVYKGKHTLFYFPIVTSLILSVLLSLALWLISWLMRR